MRHDEIKHFAQPYRLKRFTATGRCSLFAVAVFWCSITALQSGFSLQPAHRQRQYQKPPLVLFCSVMRSARLAIYRYIMDEDDVTYNSGFKQNSALMLNEGQRGLCGERLSAWAAQLPVQPAWYSCPQNRHQDLIPCCESAPLQISQT